MIYLSLIPRTYGRVIFVLRWLRLGSLDLILVLCRLCDWHHYNNNQTLHLIGNSCRLGKNHHHIHPSSYRQVFATNQIHQFLNRHSTLRFSTVENIFKLAENRNYTFSFEPKNILGGAKFSNFWNIQSFQGFSFKKLFPFLKSWRRDYSWKLLCVSNLWNQKWPLELIPGCPDIYKLNFWTDISNFLSHTIPIIRSFFVKALRI